MDDKLSGGDQPQNNDRRGDNYGLILQAISRVEAIVTTLDDRVRALERATVEQSVTAAQKLDALFRRVDEHANCINALEKDVNAAIHDRVIVTDNLRQRIQDVEGAIALLKWVAAGIGGLALVLLWNIIIGQVRLP